MVADHRDAMVEAGSGRAGDAPVLWVARALSCGCSLAVRYLEARRSRGPPTEGRGLGKASRPADFIRLVPSSGDSAFGMEARTALAMASPTFDPTATGPSGLAIANHVGRLISEYTGRGPTKARTSFSADLVTVVVGDLLTKGERSLVRDSRADLVLDLRRAYQARRATIHRPNRRSHRTPRQPHRPRHRDRERRARPKTTGTIAIMLSLRLHDAEAGGSSARRRCPPVRSSIPRPATRSSPRRKPQRFALCSLNPRCPVAWRLLRKGVRKAQEPDWWETCRDSSLWPGSRPI